MSRTEDVAESAPPSSATAPKGDAYSAIRWSALSKYGSTVVQFAVSLLLARLLAPEYFGLLGMAVVITGFANKLKGLGFNAAIIQRRDVDHALLSTLFWVNLGFSSLVTLSLILASPLATWIYQDDQVAPLVAALSLNIFFNAFCTVPSSLLQKRMELKKLAVREIGGVLVSALVGVTCALTGFGVWALALSSIAGSLTSLVLLNAIEPFRPALMIDRKRLKECLKFGLNITGFSLFTYSSKNVDNLIIGISLGPLALGYYSLARRFMVLPRDSISQVVTRVLFPKLAELQDADERLAQAFLRTVSGIAFISFPTMAGLALVADPFIYTFLGPAWVPAAPVVSMLAIVGALQSLTSLCGPLYLSKGRSDLMFRWGIVFSLSYVVAIAVGIVWGLNGVAACYLFANIALFVPELAIPFTLVNALTIRRLARSLAPYFIATAAMAVAVRVVSEYSLGFAGGSRSLPGLGVSIVAGVLTYTTVILILRPPALADLRSLLTRSK